MVNDISKLQANGRVNQEIDAKNAEKAQREMKRTNSEKQDAAPKIDTESKEQEKVKASVYGSVIGSSKDGDTVSAKKQAMEALNTGMVFKRDAAAQNAAAQNAAAQNAAAQNAAAQNAAAQNAAAQNADVQKADVKKADVSPRELVKEAQEKKEVKEKREVSELEQATDDKLDAMFEQGKITKIKYDEESKRREMLRGEDNKKAVEEKQAEKKEDKKEEEKAEKISAEKKSPVIEEIEDNKKNESKVEKLSQAAMDSGAVAKVKEDERAQAQKEQATKPEEEKSATESAQIKPKRTFDIEEEVKDDRAFAEEMGKMVAKENDEKIRSDAMEQAVKSGREELMSQIFGNGQE